MLRDSFLLFTEQIELLEQLTDEQAGKLIKSIYHYAQTGEEENLDPMSRLVFTSMRQDLDRNAQKYEEKRQKMSENGRKGGRPKKDESAVGQATPDNSSDLTNNFSIANARGIGILSSKGEGNRSETQQNQYLTTHENTIHDSPLTSHISPLTNKKGAVGQALPDNFSDLTNNSSVANARGIGILSSEGEENRDEIQQNSSDGVGQALPDNKADKVTDEERDILRNYVRKNKLASKSVEGYVLKIIQNGDYKRILNEEAAKNRPKISREERIQAELAEIHDKRSCARVLYRYHLNGEGPPDEFWDLMKKYNLEKYDQLYDYIISLSKESEDKKRLAG